MSQKQFVLMVGPQGAGKTTFCELHLKNYTRFSQDDQGKNYRNLLISAIEKSEPYIVIDRINHLRSQRKDLTSIARKHGYHVKYIWLDCDKNVCLERLVKRKNHPTIKENSNLNKILSIYFASFQLPRKDEYDSIDIKKIYKKASTLDLRATIGNDRYAVIGDVHGCWRELRQLIEKNNLTNDWLIFTGDLTDRGSYPCEVLEYVFNNDKCFCVRGNHDDKLVRALKGNKVKTNRGLQETLDKLTKKPELCKQVLEIVDSFPNIIRLPDIVRNLSLASDEKDLIPNYVVHAGFNGNRSPNDQKVQDTMYMRYFGGSNYFDETHGHLWYEDLNGSYHVFFGHIPHKDPYPHNSATAVDGGCFKGGDDNQLRAFIKDKGIVFVPSQSTWVEDINVDVVHDTQKNRTELLEALRSKCAKHYIGEE